MLVRSKDFDVFNVLRHFSITFIGNVLVVVCWLVFPYLGWTKTKELVRWLDIIKFRKTWLFSFNVIIDKKFIGNESFQIMNKSYFYLDITHDLYIYMPDNKTIKVQVCRKITQKSWKSCIYICYFQWTEMFFIVKVFQRSFLEDLCNYQTQSWFRKMIVVAIINDGVNRMNKILGVEV